VYGDYGEYNNDNSKTNHENEMGGAYSIYGTIRNGYIFQSQNIEEGGNFRHPDTGGKIIL
jgi:hypothetical protein